MLQRNVGCFTYGSSGITPTHAMLRFAKRFHGQDAACNAYVALPRRMQINRDLRVHSASFSALTNCVCEHHKPGVFRTCFRIWLPGRGCTLDRGIMTYDPIGQSERSFVLSDRNVKRGNTQDSSPCLAFGM